MVTEEEYQKMKEEFEKATLKPTSQIPNSVYSEKEELEIVELTEDQNGIPIVEDNEEEEESLFIEEVRTIIELDSYKCPIDGEEFKSIVDFLAHWKEKHEEKYGLYKDFRKYKYPKKEEELSKEDTNQMLRYWVISKQKSRSGS